VPSFKVRLRLDEQIQRVGVIVIRKPSKWAPRRGPRERAAAGGDVVQARLGLHESAGRQHSLPWRGATSSGVHPLSCGALTRRASPAPNSAGITIGAHVPVRRISSWCQLCRNVFVATLKLVCATLLRRIPQAPRAANSTIPLESIVSLWWAHMKLEKLARRPQVLHDAIPAIREALLLQPGFRKCID
jgi:hypothetical protein